MTATATPTTAPLSGLAAIDGIGAALMFGGQGTPWRPTLVAHRDDPDIAAEIDVLVAAAGRLLAPVAAELLPLGLGQVDFTAEPVHEPAPAAARAERADSSTIASVPGLLLAQYAGVLGLIRAGADPRALLHLPSFGHSQGQLAVALVAGLRAESGSVEPATLTPAEVLAVAHLIGAAARQTCLTEGLSRTSSASPMLSVRGLTRAELDQVITGTVGLHGCVTVAVSNDRTSQVLSGDPADLTLVAAAAVAHAETVATELAEKRHGGAAPRVVTEFLNADAPFHSPLLGPAAEAVAALADRCGIDAAAARALADHVLVDPMDWPATLAPALAQPDAVLIDLGPGDALGRLTRPLIEGTGAGIAAAGSAAAIDVLAQPGSTIEHTTPWTDRAPGLLTLPDGSTVVDTAFSRLTGRSPVLLAGMTPTTVDAEIVAAAANAGHWTEVAGGGQYSQESLNETLDGLKRLLHPGRAAQFNSMFMDRFLWNLQFGTQQVVTRARQSGAPLDGVVISAGIPELDEAIALVTELRGAGFPFVAFKPGTVDQIRQVVAIATAVAPVQIIMQVEDGRAGGHHSWESLDDLLLRTYAEIRRTPNLVLCVGGGIGTPEKAADFLSGDWSHRYDRPAMPVDGVMVGTAAMATKEARTTRAVKQLLLDTPGTPMTENDGWVPAGEARGGVTSGLSHLRADMYEIENAVARCSRIVVEVSSHPEQIPARRAEIIEALDATSKPYFGDVEQMTYAGLVQRYVDLCVPWIDDDWIKRFWSILQRVEARLNPAQTGEIATRFAHWDSVRDASTASAELLAQYPAARTTTVVPSDAAWFVDVCREHAKPVPFVPVIDEELLRWWGRDSLWQSQDERYSADSVLIIPSPVSVAGIDRIDEPVGELLGRFEAAAVDRIAGTGVAPVRAATRLTGPGESADDEIRFIRSARFIVWTGHLVDNPAALLPASQIRIVPVDPARHSYDLRIHLDTWWDEEPDGAAEFAVREQVIPVILPHDTQDGGYPVVDPERLPEQMYGLLAATAGVGSVSVVGDPVERLPRTVPCDGTPFGRNELEFSLTPTLGSLHASVTAGSMEPPRVLAPLAPDALLGPAWPAIYAALGSATLPDGFPVIEGLLNAVHLDHAIGLHQPLDVLNSGRITRVKVTSAVTALTESSSGRVIEVGLSYHACGGELDGSHLLDLTERFAIRGRANGTTAPGEPAQYGGLPVRRTTAARRLLRAASVVAPADMTAFARVTGDYNPIHTSHNAAVLAGLSEPLVHGMWLSAAAQHVLAATDENGESFQILGWTYTMFGMVALGDVVDITVERTGLIDGGGLLLDVTCRVADTIVSRATAAVAAPRTAYVFPGQGIQQQGMGLAERAQSRAATQAWEQADRHTRAVLGFSIIALVRDNPTDLTAAGVSYHHPDGLLNLTQFTQVALAVVGFAQAARMREAGVLVDDAFFAGHSLGEYNALSSIAQIFPIETVVEIVFHRGATMHQLIERDASGRSNYRMGVLRPNQFGVGDDTIADYVASVSADSGEFLEIVNHNLAGEQYSIAGTVAGLEALQADAERRAELAGGKRPFMLVPGVDVPFHSRVLHPGVPEFRAKLEELLDESIDPTHLIGRYVPNLVARPFELTPEFVQSIIDVVPADNLVRLVREPGAFDAALADPAQLARTLLIDLLAWQFASPVRWIETQALLFSATSHGGAGVRHLVEIGLANAPTLANLATKTIALPQFVERHVVVHNLQRDESRVYCTDTDPAVRIAVTDEADGIDDAAEPIPTAEPAAAEPATTPAPASTSKPTSGAPAADLSFTAADAISALLAMAAKIRPDQVVDSDTTESLTNGVSSRRNQLLMDLSAELSLASIDGAADAQVGQLLTMVDRLAHGYVPFGPVLGEAIRSTTNTLFGSAGVKQQRIADRVQNGWQLGTGWVAATTVALFLGTREGASVRGGELATLPTTPATSAAQVDALIDAAVQSAAAARGVAVELPSTGGAGGGEVVSSAALDALSDQMLGDAGVLATMAKGVLEQLGLATIADAADDQDATDAARLVGTVSAELGPDWPRLVEPGFDAARAVLIDDRWATAREDLARVALGAEDTDDLPSFRGAGSAVADQADWWQAWADRRGRAQLAGWFAQVAAEARCPQSETPGEYDGQIAVVTGATPESIAGALAARLLAGGATVIMTASRVDAGRLAFAKRLYRRNAAVGAALWLVPVNLNSYRDVDALIDWIGNEAKTTVGGQAQVVKAAQVPDLLFPFAAPNVHGSLADAGPAAEHQTRLLLWSVERLIAGLSRIGGDVDIAHRLHVVLPGSPNRGIFGGDGAYGEVKAAFDAIVGRWSVEDRWAEHVSIAHPLIGWVRGTGLMHGNDPLVAAVEAQGVTTWSTEQIADALLALCTAESRARAAHSPIEADLTGGLGSADFDFAALRVADASQVPVAEPPSLVVPATIAALPTPRRAALPAVDLDDWASVTARPQDLVVVVGAGEIGPWGSGRTRLEAELGIGPDGVVDLTPAGVLELAWLMGLLTWRDSPIAGWYDTSDTLVDESDVFGRFRDEVVARSGVRSFVQDGALLGPEDPHAVRVFLDHPTSFTVRDEHEARQFADSDPEHTTIGCDPESGEWTVTRTSGGSAYVPKRATLSRTVGGQLPTGFDPAKWGIPVSMLEAMDPLAAWNLVATVDAFLSSGFSPAELLQAVHPADVADTQGTGFGGTQSMRKLFVDQFLSQDTPSDILQESLPNVVAAHVMQSYIGGYGSMIQPVGACATAAVSVEEGVDKISCGKATFVVAGAIDDIAIESIRGFGNMNATAVSAEMAAKGIDERFYSRANDRRRGGFVESQGGGTILLARGDLAAELGLPVLGVIGYTHSFADGIHTSIPAPGLGALAAGRGGPDSQLARNLAALGVTPDDIAVVSKHDTSTSANDPNESELHTRLARALGRSAGNPLFVISQKSVTGHAKGGAFVFQLGGLLHLFAGRRLPANVSLDCLDEVFRDHEFFVWPRSPLSLADFGPIKAGLVTSLGFGHVSSLTAMVHPGAFEAAVAHSDGVEAAKRWRTRANDRLATGSRRIQEGMIGRRALFEPSPERRFASGTPGYDAHEAEAAMLLDPDARLGQSGNYESSEL